MFAFRYTALRELVTSTSPIHASGTVYDLQFRAGVYQPFGAARVTVHRSIGGQQETVGQSHDLGWVVQPTGITAAQFEAWDEFLHSVQYGESFFLIPDYSASPLTLKSVLWEQAAWEFARMAEAANAYQLPLMRLRLL